MIEGRLIRLGDNISGDMIISGELLGQSLSPEELVPYLLKNVCPDFALRCAQGSIISAGENFGCGSSREVVVATVKAAKIKYVIAKSFSRSFYRGAINAGIFPIVCKESFADGEKITINIENNKIIRENGSTVPFDSLPPQVAGYINEGGILNYYKAYHKLPD